MVWGRGSAQVLQRLTEQFSSLFPQLYAQQAQGTAVHLPILAHPRTLQSVNDLLRSQFFGINQRVNTHSVEHCNILLACILAIIHTGNSLPCTQSMSQHTARNIARLVRGYCNKQIRMGNTGLLLCSNACWRHTHCKQVIVTVGQRLHLLRILVHQNNIMILLREQFSQVSSYCTCTSNDYLHKACFIASLSNPTILYNSAGVPC